MKYRSYHNRGCGNPHEITGDADLAHLGKVVFAKFSSVKSFFFSFSLSLLCFRSGSLSIAQSLVGDIVELNYFLKGVASRYIIWTSSLRKNFPFSVLIYLFIHTGIFILYFVDTLF